tara:strand:+ start:11747 stop:12088 length:342 start_codon:yes stop_codon:yes gene_type:complete
MKSIVLLCSFCILFTSCYSYRPINQTSATILAGNKYHFDLKNGTEFNKKIDSVGKDVYYITKGGKVRSIAFSDVSKLEEGSFSTGRTLGFSGLVTLGAAIIAGFILFVSSYKH